MLKTFNKAEWMEDPLLEAARNQITSKTPPEELRRLFPFKAIVTKRCVTYLLEEGAVVEYARARCAPGYFPIEGLAHVGQEGIMPKKICLNSEEAQLMEV